jgi:hypothetical protein
MEENEFAITRDILIQKNKEEKDEEKPFVSKKRLIIYSVVLPVILYLCVLLFVHQALIVDEECKQAGKCTVVNIVESPTYKVVYQDMRWQKRYLFNPDSSFNFGDKYVTPGETFEFKPWCCIFKSVKN